MAQTNEKTRAGRINARPFLFCALGLFFGITLYFSVRFGGVSPANFVFYAIFFALALFPFSRRRILLILVALLLFGGLGALSAHLYAERYESGTEGSYVVTGTVESFTKRSGYGDAVLRSLDFDGESRGGKMEVRISSEAVSVGDVVVFEGEVEKVVCDGTSYGEWLFSEDIRYTAHGEYALVGETRDPFLRLTRRLKERIDEGMGGEEGEIAFALLTGDSHGMDAGLLDSVRRGGIAHIFAVSGLHIGILFGALSFAFKPLGRYATAPAAAGALLYTAFCGFTASSVRAALMCTALGVSKAYGRKYDFLESVSAAALCILLLSPASALSTGFLLSFGACLGLALYGGTLRRAFRRLPFLGNFLASYLSVQTLTVPVLLSSFGYLPLWGILLNFLILPALSVLFLTVLLFAFAAVCLPLSCAGMLIVPKGLLSLLLLLLSAEFTATLSGFVLGGGAAVWIAGFVFCSERVRMKGWVRAGVAAAACLCLGVCLALENISFGGRVYFSSRGKGSVALVEVGSTAALILDEEASLSLCRDLLTRRYAGELDAAFVLGEDELTAINLAAALRPACVCAREETATGLKTTPLRFGESFSFDGVAFRYEGKDRLVVTAHGVSVGFGFDEPCDSADFFAFAGNGDLIFSFGHGIIGT